MSAVAAESSPGMTMCPKCCQHSVLKQIHTWWIIQQRHIMNSTLPAQDCDREKAIMKNDTSRIKPILSCTLPPITLLKWNVCLQFRMIDFISNAAGSFRGDCGHVRHTFRYLSQVMRPMWPQTLWNGWAHDILGHILGNGAVLPCRTAIYVGVNVHQHQHISLVNPYLTKLKLTFWPC